MLIALSSGCFDDPFQLEQHAVAWKTLDSAHFRFHYLDDPTAIWRHTPFVQIYEQW